MLNFKEYWNLIEEGLYANNNQLDYTTVDRKNDLLHHHQKSFLFNIASNCKLFVAYLCDKEINIDDIYELYHVFKGKRSRFEIGDVNGIKTIIQNGVSNFIKHTNITPNLIITADSTSNHVSDIAHTFNNYFTSTPLINIKKLSIVYLKTLCNSITTAIPNIQTAIDNDDYKLLLKEVYNNYHNKHIQTLANQFIETDAHFNNTKILFYTLLCALIYNIEKLSPSNSLSINRHIKTTIVHWFSSNSDDDIRKIFISDPNISKSLNSKGKIEYPHDSYITKYLKNLTSLSSTPPLNSNDTILIIDDNVNDGNTIITDTKTIRNTYKTQHIMWFCLLGSEKRIFDSPNFKNISYKTYTDYFKNFNTELFGDHKTELSNIIKNEKISNYNKLIDSINILKQTFDNIPNNKDNIKMKYDIYVKFINLIKKAYKINNIYGTFIDKYTLLDFSYKNAVERNALYDNMSTDMSKALSIFNKRLKS